MFHAAKGSGWNGFRAATVIMQPFLWGVAALPGELMGVIEYLCLFFSPSLIQRNLRPDLPLFPPHFGAHLGSVLYRAYTLDIRRWNCNCFLLFAHWQSLSNREPSSDALCICFGFVLFFVRVIKNVLLGCCISASLLVCNGTFGASSLVEWGEYWHYKHRDATVKVWGWKQY